MASQKVSQSLAGYGDQTASLTALNSTAAQLNSYVDGAQSVADKLATQDTALSTVSTAAQAARTAIAQAVGQDNATTLIQTLQAQLTTAASALNTQYQGQYLFSGGQVNTPPVATTSLSSLNTPADVTAAFKNGQVVSASRLDANTVVPTGVLASDVGTPLFNALQAVQAYNAGPDGPLTGALTSDQQTFLSGVLSQFDGALASTTRPGRRQRGGAGPGRHRPDQPQRPADRHPGRDRQHHRRRSGPSSATSSTWPPPRCKPPPRCSRACSRIPC